MDRDQAVQITQNEFPEFSIKMGPYNVEKVFLLTLPPKFCKSYMPKEDEEITLVDKGQETATKFFAETHRLSRGWNKFARDHKLLKEDVLVFCRIATAPHKLQVKICRKAHPRASTFTADDLNAADDLIAADALIALAANVPA